MIIRTLVNSTNSGRLVYWDSGQKETSMGSEEGVQENQSHLRAE